MCRAFAHETSKLHSTLGDWWWLGELQRDAIASDDLVESIGLKDRRLLIDGLGCESVLQLALGGDFSMASWRLLEADLFVVASVSLPKSWRDYFTLNPQRKRQLLSLSL